MTSSVYMYTLTQGSAFTIVGCVPGTQGTDDWTAVAAVDVFQDIGRHYVSFPVEAQPVEGQ